MRRFIITIDGFPPRDASPNARVHYMKLHAVKKEQGELMTGLILAQGIPAKPMEKAHLTITFESKDKRKRDIDNLLASCKAYIDALVPDVIVDDNAERLSLSLYYKSKTKETRIIFELEEQTK
jgi:crossover junction endodeoxyribonuclease RusA